MLGTTSISTKKKSIAVSSKNPQSRRSSFIPFFPSLNLVHSYRLVIELIVRPFNRLLTVSKLTDKEKHKSKEKQRKHCGGYECFNELIQKKPKNRDGESSHRFAYTGHVSGIYCACIGGFWWPTKALLEQVIIYIEFVMKIQVLSICSCVGGCNPKHSFVYKS